MTAGWWGNPDRPAYDEFPLEMAEEYDCGDNGRWPRTMVGGIIAMKLGLSSCCHS